GPFHTPLMAPAGEALRTYFRDVTFQEARIPVFFNCLGDSAAGPKTDVPQLLVRQVQSSVYMEQCIRNMAVGPIKVDALVEIGPGKALSGFAKKTVPETPVCAVETAADVEGLTDALKRELDKKEAEKDGKTAAAKRAQEE
ncbi:ACP S-malonyltransferase, partial [uncultured Oscillibacter sp.]|uniref:ACP S-malonyltransferase n=1 Tax=uncultured Oscillibacter sp. TaxID=876091 RepID=UPI00345BD44E